MAPSTTQAQTRSLGLEGTRDPLCHPQPCPCHLEGSRLGAQAKMLAMLDARMMTRMMQHTMIKIFFCSGRQRM